MSTTMMTDAATATAADPTSGTMRARWVAFGPAGAVGSIHRNDDGYLVKMVSDGRYRGVFGTLNAAKNALHAAMGAGAEWPEFHEH